jgi:acylphosphatase
MDTEKKIKIFLFRFNSPMLIEVARRLKKAGVDIAYWEASRKYFEQFRKNNHEFPNTVFHDTFEAVRGISAEGINTETFEPIGKEFAKEMLECESQVLSMMNAVDLDNTPLSKKKHIYYQYLKYWRGLIKELKPDAIIFGDIPHIAHQYTLYCLAKKMGIKVIMYRTLQVRGRMIFMNDHTDYRRLREEVEKAKDKKYKLEDLSSDVQDNYKKYSDKKAEPHPFYTRKSYLNRFLEDSSLFPGVSKIIKNIKRLAFFRTTLSYIRMFFIKRKHASLEGFEHSAFVLRAYYYKLWRKIRLSYKKEYEKLQTAVDFSKNYIYVALHNQPECSTSAMGDIFVDQILMIDILSASIPRDWVVYVKETPLQWSMIRGHLGRYKGYYEEIKKRKNVALVPAEISTFELIKHARAVASVTGTVGWEAILRSKPALVFGYIFYMYCDGAFRVSNVAECKEAINIIRKGYLPDKQKVINFLAALDKVSVKSFPNMRFKQDLPISVEDNINNISRALFKELDL